jgi:hypothetical protein
MTLPCACTDREGDVNQTTKFDSLAVAAKRYGGFSLENYTRIRGVAEHVAKGFCAYLGDAAGPCTHLVPPDGDWTAQSYRSGAFSVSGSGFLPLEPISFGLAVRVSNTNDWLRIVLRCAKLGETLNIGIRNGRTFSLDLPLRDEDMTGLFDHLHQHLVDWFTDHADRYEHGDYGSSDIGFDFLHRIDDETS